MAAETSAETISRILSSYELGSKLRRLRLRKKLGLKELGNHTGLSPSMLSQLETGQLVPTLPTLARIAMVFDVGIEHFFEKRPRKVVAIARAGERVRLPDRPDSPEPAYFFEALAYGAQNKSFESYLADFPHRKSRAEIGHFHEGAEFLYIVEGELEIRFGEDEVVELSEGDAIYFDSSAPHSYRGSSRKGARAVVVSVPPR
ncbi:MAG TPA: XRE family transcriptional regulator [Bryobacteraceae bacterium]|nr:XRE family transcriptional regulator [Bryobacteraceae bacterium]